MKHIIAILISMLFVIAAQAQTTVFTYQGKLADANMAANGTYDFVFRIFDAGGSQIGTEIVRDDVMVTDGIFTVNLDFGGASFVDSSAATVQIAVRPGASTGAYTTLAPRKPLTSSPYAIKSMNANLATNATQLGGFAANQYVQTNDPRMTDARAPTPGSGDYIQNQNASAQTSANFNISGTGTANFVNAITQFNIGGSRVLGVAGTRNAFAGIGAGQSNVFGAENAFFGFNAGFANIGNSIGIAGNFNSYVGSRAGENNVLGRFNSFFGAGAGRLSMANNNSIFGAGAGEGSTTGSDNSMFGTSAGQSATTGSNNSFFGVSAGAGFTAFGDPPTPNTGSENSYFGAGAGLWTSTGRDNAYFGNAAGQRTRSGSQNAFFGRLAGFNNSGGNQNSFFGHSAGGANTSGFGNTFVGFEGGLANTTGLLNTVIGHQANLSASNSFFQTVIGAGAIGSGSNTVTLGRDFDRVVVRGRTGIGSDLPPVTQLEIFGGPPWTTETGLEAWRFLTLGQSAGIEAVHSKVSALVKRTRGCFSFVPAVLPAVLQLHPIT